MPDIIAKTYDYKLNAKQCTKVVIEWPSQDLVIFVVYLTILLLQIDRYLLLEELTLVN